jgi:hypothetical protein
MPETHRDWMSYICRYPCQKRARWLDFFSALALANLLTLLFCWPLTFEKTFEIFLAAVIDEMQG